MARKAWREADCGRAGGIELRKARRNQAQKAQDSNNPIEGGLWFQAVDGIGRFF